MTCEWCVAMGNGLFCLGFGGFLESQNAVFHSIDLVTVFGEAFVVGDHDSGFAVLLGLLGEELYDFESFFGVVGSGCDREEVNKSGFKSGFILRQVKMGLDGKKRRLTEIGCRL